MPDRKQKHISTLKCRTRKDQKECGYWLMCSKGGRVPVKLEKFTLSTLLLLHRWCPLGPNSLLKWKLHFVTNQRKTSFFLLSLETYQLSWAKSSKFNPKNKILKMIIFEKVGTARTVASSVEWLPGGNDANSWKKPVICPLRPLNK